MSFQSSRSQPMRPSKYTDMLVQADRVPGKYNVFAALFTWLLLAGYIVLPATFNKLQKYHKWDDSFKSGPLKQVKQIDIPLGILASVLCFSGVAGCLWLLLKYRRNYIWITNRMFIPALLHSIAGLVSTLINVYTAQDGKYSITATAALTGTCLCFVVTLSLTLLVYVGKIRRIKKKHDAMQRMHHR